MLGLPTPKPNGQSSSHALPGNDKIEHPNHEMEPVTNSDTPSKDFMLPPEARDRPSPRLIKPSFSQTNYHDSHRYDTVKQPPTSSTSKCHLCQKSFTRADNLRRHLRNHACAFACAVCGATFTRPYNLARHEKVHHTEKLFVCKGDLDIGGQWGCGKEFTHIDALARHFRSEAGRICIKPLQDKEVFDGKRKPSFGEQSIDPESDQQQIGAFTLPSSLLAQYPALAQINWQANASKSIDDENPWEEWQADDIDEWQSSFGFDPSDDTSSNGFSNLFGPAPMWLSEDIRLSSIEQEVSNNLDYHTEEEFSRRFARCLASRSGAYTWGKSVMERLGRECLFLLFRDLLGFYLADSANMKGFPSVREATLQTAGDICTRFGERIGSTNSNTEAVRSLSSAESATTSSLVNRRQHLDQDFLGIADEFMSSESFESLSQLVRERLYSTPQRSMECVIRVFGAAFKARLGSIRSRRLRYSPVASVEAEVVVETNLSLLDYIKHNFPDDRIELSTLLTLTGTAFYAYATTCLDYLGVTWPNTGDVLLPLLQDTIQKVLDRPNASASVVKDLDHSWVVSTDLRWDGLLKLGIRGSVDFVLDVTQQLCWLNATFSSSPFSDEAIAYCNPVVERISDETLAKPTIKLSTSFTKLTSDEKNSCWLSLFSNAVIAYGFPIPERANGMGLEMSVKLMAAIVGARHAATFDGGIVIKGFSSMFVPVKRTKDGIQWHYVANSDPEVQLPYDEGVKQCPVRSLLPDVDFKSLMTARCFIGWSNLVQIRLGLEANDFDNIDFSDAAEVKSTLQIPSASVGFQQFGLAQINVRFGKRDGLCHFQRNSSYRRIVAASERMFIALFDTGDRRGCLVAASVLLLHILHHRVRSGLGGVPSSKVNIASAGTSAETLLKNAKLRLSSEDDEPLFLDEVVSEIWSILELLQAQSISAEKNSKPEIHATWQERLLGYEYKGVVEDWSPMPLKELEILKTCGGWPKLVRDVNALVLLANGLGDLI